MKITFQNKTITQSKHSFITQPKTPIIPAWIEKPTRTDPYRLWINPNLSTTTPPHITVKNIDDLTKNFDTKPITCLLITGPKNPNLQHYPCDTIIATPDTILYTEKNILWTIPYKETSKSSYYNAYKPKTYTPTQKTIHNILEHLENTIGAQEKSHTLDTIPYEYAHFNNNPHLFYKIIHQYKDNKNVEHLCEKFTNVYSPLIDSYRSINPPITTTVSTNKTLKEFLNELACGTHSIKAIMSTNGIRILTVQTSDVLLNFTQKHITFPTPHNTHKTLPKIVQSSLHITLKPRITHTTKDLLTTLCSTLHSPTQSYITTIKIDQNTSTIPEYHLLLSLETNISTALLNSTIYTLKTTAHTEHDNLWIVSSHKRLDVVTGSYKDK